jgi:hypothetical protein
MTGVGFGWRAAALTWVALSPAETYRQGSGISSVPWVLTSQ